MDGLTDIFFIVFTYNPCILILSKFFYSFRTVQRSRTNKNPTTYAATSPHTDVILLAILKTVTLASTSNALPEDSVCVPKHVGAV